MRRPWYTYTTGLKDALGREIPDEAFENDASYNPKAAEHYSDGFLQRAIERISRRAAAAKPPAVPAGEAPQDQRGSARPSRE